MTDLNQLEKKAWYRFCKLCYGFAYAFALAFAVAIGYAAFPIEYIDSDESIVVCASGSRHSARAISGYLSSSELDSFDDKKAKQLCSRDEKAAARGRFLTPDEVEEAMRPWEGLQESNNSSLSVKNPPNLSGTVVPDSDLPPDLREQTKNYVFIPVKAVQGGYGTLLWGVGIVLFLGEIIRRSFLYVVAGKPFIGFRGSPAPDA